MELLTPTTELQAVNVLLGAIGETPLSTLDGIDFTDAAIALDTLRSVSREVQTKGWYFNKDEGYAFTPATDGQVALPDNVVSVRPAPVNYGETRSIAERQRKLYDRTNKTFTFPADTPPVVTVIWQFVFEELPESVRRYVTIQAAVLFQTERLGNDQLYVFTTDHAKKAYVALSEEERLYETPANFFSDSADVSEIWLR